ncbi:hypothetical protein I4F81_006854 [Pyropia yezoensis]|uniref:Uncharacterized protein n=1 Tax=Pyropia yezoensis TaxID=2788 RepID=A0ACC3C3I2_PYRYE|nr:hypothetical protein I4F81_006854 [Neopyropia yezoensis]
MAPRLAVAASAAVTGVVLLVAALAAAQPRPPAAGGAAPAATPPLAPTGAAYATPAPTATPVMVAVPTMAAAAPAAPAAAAASAAAAGVPTPMAMPAGQPRATPGGVPPTGEATPTPTAVPPMASPAPATGPGATPMPTTAPGGPPGATPPPTGDSSATAAPSILGFWVLNATSGGWLFPLTPSTVLSPAALGAYSIAAVPSTGINGGVTFTSPAKYAHTEVSTPFLLGWDTDGAPQPVFLRPGFHTVSAYVLTPDGGRGPAASVTFTVVFPPVTDFWVVDADTTRPTNGQRLFRLLDGMVLDAASVGRWSIEAAYGPGDGLAVRFTAPPQYAHLEQGERPHMMAPASPGLIWPARLPLGRHTVSAHAEDWRGERGPAKTVSFVVDDSESN